MKSFSRKTMVWVVAACMLLAAMPVQSGIVPPANNVEISDAGLNGRLSLDTSLFVRGNTVYAVWRDARHTDSILQMEIYFSKSTDGGQTWGPNYRVSDPEYVGHAVNPRISVAPDGSIWVAWGLTFCHTSDASCGGSDSIYNDVRVAVSRDGGVTWSENRIWNGDTPGSFDAATQSPELHAENDHIHVLAHHPIYQNGTLAGFDLYLVTRILTSSTSVSGPTSTVYLTPESDALGKVNGSADGPNMAIARRGNTLCVAWEDARERFSIFGTCSTDGGTTFAASARWSTNGDDFSPRLAIGPDGRLYLAYRDAEKKNIVLRTSVNNGATWSAQRTLADVGTDYSFSFDLDVGPDNQMILVYVVGTASGSITDMFAVTSIDGGQTLGTVGPIERGNAPRMNTSQQLSARVKTGGTSTAARAYFVWVDNRNDKNQVWSANANLDATPPSPPSNLRATNGNASVLLQWDPSADANGVDHYRVYRATTSGGPYAQINALPVKQTFYRDVGLAAGAYYYVVVGVDGTANSSAPTNQVTGSPIVGGALPDINGVLAYNTGGAVGIRTLTHGAVGIEGTRPGAYPAFSTDGANLLFVRDANGNSTVVKGNRLGENPLPVISDPLPFYDIDLSSDGNHIAAVQREEFNGACVPIEARTFSIAPKVRIAGTYALAVDAVAISPDRHWMAYTNRLFCDIIGTVIKPSHEICLVDLTATGTPDAKCMGPANVKGVDFGNNGNAIVFSADYSGQNEIWRASLTPSGEPFDLVQLTRGPAGQPSTYPSVSTDGNWVIFVRDVDGGPAENLQAHVVRIDGDGVRSLAFPASKPVWSGGGQAAPPIGGGGKRAFLPGISR